MTRILCHVASVTIRAAGITVSGPAGAVVAVTAGIYTIKKLVDAVLDD